ncbi:hypothetical protein RUMGNA_02743 [Mediterraneibacter gnavus ATCC 29149]|uniref:Uncharacterized protein n=1 Tax=Mediterraneibacter gnavus (strain ATCC 29149 / DSM 114966 / JCM 6515 / VPI C7-9) TaxID=411470 RepID=A7B5A7_MEDG7|nr:hypothetical protein RUMGNA_02743 [Mediterraneibacter gnavus ATCC 29149]
MGSSATVFFRGLSFSKKNMDRGSFSCDAAGICRMEIWR